MPSSQAQRVFFKKYIGQEFTVIALYAAYSEARNEFAYDTILLKQVKDENKFPLCDHLWVKAPRYVPGRIRLGDFIKVRGRITDYIRLDGSIDYTLFVFYLKWGKFE